MRLARDLHDVLAHNLALIVVQAEAAEASESAGAGLQSHLGRIATTGRNALTDLRALLPTLRGDADATAPSLNRPEPRLGVRDLEDLTNRLGVAGVDVHLSCAAGELSNLPPPFDECIYRIVQEGLTNALRHSTCRSVDVTVAYSDRQVRVTVTDAGPAAERALEASSGYGLQTMRERVSALGGSVSAGSERDGFRISAVLPLPPDLSAGSGLVNTS